MADRGLGRLPAPDDKHLRRFPLTADTLPRTPTPVVFGLNWYRGFNKANLIQRDGAYWLPPRSQWGPIEGGHAICSRPPALTDLDEWHSFYDQGETPHCVGFAICRQQTLLNRRRYSGHDLYFAAAEADEWPGNDDGTSVRAGEEVVRTQGAWRWRNGKAKGPYVDDGIQVYRWAATPEDIAACLSPVDNGASVLNAGYVIWLQSWGAFYPHEVRVDLEAVNTLAFAENGDACVVTDR